MQFSSIDVSFISLTKVLLPIRNYLTDEGQIVALIKPQFEAGREKVGKKGVVREKSTHIEVIHKVIDYAMSIGFEVLNLEFSPIKDRKAISNIWSTYRNVKRLTESRRRSMSKRR